MRTDVRQPKSKPRRTRLTPLGQKILKACLEQPTFARAAEAAGVSTATLWRYRQKPEFQKAMSELGREGLDEALARLQQVAVGAANINIKIMQDPASPAYVRFRAAEVILTHSRESMFREDIEARMGALEASGQQLGPRLVPKPADSHEPTPKSRPPVERSRRQERILLALLEHPTDESAAAAAGVSAQTVARCRKKPEFKKIYLEARRMILAQAMIRMQQACPLAAHTIFRLAAEPGTPPATRLRAADAIIRFGLQGLEFDTCEARLAELEQETLPIRRTA
jgi:hypothetical protein